MIRTILATPLALLALLAAAWGANLKGSAAVLQGMDKVTARISTFDAEIGKTTRYGDLEIVVRTCRKRPPEEPPESAAFVEIFEAKKDRERRKVFSGWMFASSPALSAMEHPVYDIWVIDCRVPGAKKPAPDGPKKASKSR